MQVVWNWILPALGGRIAELRQAGDAPNHLFLDEKQVRAGAGQTYRIQLGAHQHLAVHPPQIENDINEEYQRKQSRADTVVLIGVIEIIKLVVIKSAEH